jgi:O-antigen/teichoic acid export membrane protein
MKPKSIKINYFLNVLRISSGLMIGLFTMPYINTVLGAASLGKVEYVNSIISYFVLFSALGIPMYGIRETAKVRDDVKQRTKLILEMLAILAITTVLSYLIIFGIIIQLDYFQNLKMLIIIMSSMIFISNIGFEWFYQGMEDQLFITIRYLIVRIIALILLFLMVKSSEDYINYGIIMVITTVGGNFFNLLYLKNFINFSDIKISELNIKKHLKPIATIFLASISISIYLLLDTTMLGSIAGDKSVGYYSVANKLVRFIIVFITTLGAVMLPRLSYLIKTDKALYTAYAKKSIKYILLVSFPFTVLFFFLAKDLVLLMAGADFLPAILTLQILSPIIIIVGIAYFIGYLVLYPQGKEKIYTIAVAISAVASVLCNLYAIPHFSHYGAAAVTVISESLGVLLMVVLARNELKDLNFFSKSFLLYFLASLFMTLIIVLVSFLNLSQFYNIALSSLTGFTSFFIFLFAFKEEIIMETLIMIKSKIPLKK